MTFIFDDNHEHVKWSCDGCGAVSKTEWGIWEPIHALRHNYDLHLQGSHNRVPMDFDKWRKVWPHG